MANGKCVVCPKGCADCDANGKCTACEPGLQLDASSTCKCPAGLIFDADKCKNCSAVMEGCATCSAVLKCDSCMEGYGLQDDECASCSEIVENCVKCSSDGKCLECNSSKHLSLLNGECKCSSGYFETPKGCSHCSSQLQGCSECSSGSTCTKCMEAKGLSLDEETGRCVCDEGGLFDAKTNTCSFKIAANDIDEHESSSLGVVLRTAVVIGLILALIGFFYQRFIGLEALSLLQLCYFVPAMLQDSVVNLQVAEKLSAISPNINGYNGLELEGIAVRQLP